MRRLLHALLRDIVVVVVTATCLPSLRDDALASTPQVQFVVFLLNLREN